jgi:hypothetical protein
VGEMRQGREQVRARLKRSWAHGRSPRRARGRGSVAVAGNTEVTMGPHSAGRERVSAWANGPWHSQCRPAEQRERARAREADANKSTPLGRGREGARACRRGLSLAGGTHLPGEAGARPNWAGWACWTKFAFSFS